MFERTDPRSNVRPVRSDPRRHTLRGEGDLGGLHYEAGLEVSELTPGDPSAPAPAAAELAATGDVVGWESAGSTTDWRQR